MTTLIAARIRKQSSRSGTRARHALALRRLRPADIVQGAALFTMALWDGFLPWAASAVALGLGTAMVYPTLLAAVGDVAHPSWRASAVGVYRLWRDLGYAVGAVIAGLLADALGIDAAISAIGVLTLLSGLLVMVRMSETFRSREQTRV